MTPRQLAESLWHDAAGQTGAFVIDALTAALERERAGKPQPTEPQGPLTEAEARVLFTALASMWAPMYGYAEFHSAVAKLCTLGGGFCCRDCSNAGKYASHYGGFVCGEHKAAEDWRFALVEDAERFPNTGAAK